MAPLVAAVRGIAYARGMAEIDGALAAFYAGDLAGLGRQLAADPGLVTARVSSATGHYCGYFFEATLLHHVAGNPQILPLPAETPAFAALLLDRGAAVDAATHAGPSQPDDIGWSTLGLVATSLDARRTGHQRPLMELLLARGADLDFRDGGPLIGALYYGEQEAAAFLVERGARVDLVAAAGLGRIDLMARFIGADGALAPDARSLVHYSQKRSPPVAPSAILSLALVHAAMGGHRDAAGWLIDRGAAPSGRAPFDHDATPLHWAALRGRAEVAELLLERGADRTVRDTTFHATPAGWAEHEGHAALAARLAV
jgi:ankyrin repeat protein